MATSFTDHTEEVQIALMTDLGHEVMAAFSVESASIEMLNHGYNSTFAVTTVAGEKFALRINVNSPRTPKNLRAELAWMDQLHQSGRVTVPQPFANAEGELFTTVVSEALGRTTTAVLFSWLDGAEVATLEEKSEALLATGRLLAVMHHEGRGFDLPDNATLPVFDSLFWGFDNLVTGPDSLLNDDDQVLMVRALDDISEVVNRHYASTPPHIIHADANGHNLMWHNGAVAILDFDDCGVGLPLQDIATALYYLRQPSDREALLEGYRQVADLPPSEPGDLDALILLRRIHMLNYVLGSQNPRHRGELDNFWPLVRAEVEHFLSR
jgi:Ser/Thr protein kinase RdoA (MazF antagonist)